MKDLVKVFRYSKWDGQKNVVSNRWATEDAIKRFEAVKFGEDFKEVDESLLDDEGRLRLQ